MLMESWSLTDVLILLVLIAIPIGVWLALKFQIYFGSEQKKIEILDTLVFAEKAGWTLVQDQTFLYMLQAN